MQFVLYSCRLNESSTSEPKLSLDNKCKPGCCWYCEKLCSVCMHPVPLWAVASSPDLPAPEGPLPTFCGKDCQELFSPKLDSPQKVSATYNKKNVGPAKLQVSKFLPSPGATFDYIELCIGTGCEGVQIGAPYIVWQSRSITSQSFMDFFINDKFEPLECVWTSSNTQMDKYLENTAARNKISSFLQNIFALVLEKIGYKQLESFIADNLP